MDAAEKAVKAGKPQRSYAPVHSFHADVETALSQIEAMLGSEIPEEQKRFYRDQAVRAR